MRSGWFVVPNASELDHAPSELKPQDLRNLISAVAQRAAGDEARDRLGEEEVAGGVDHPPASVDLADAEVPVGIAHVRADPAAVFVEGGVGLRREAGDAVHGDGRVGDPGFG